VTSPPSTRGTPRHWPKRCSRTSVLALATGLLALLVLTLSAWLNGGTASAHPGNTCDPEPGHGTPGCHVGVSTTSLPPGQAPQGMDVVPRSGPAVSAEPNAVQMFEDQNDCLSCHGNPALATLLTRKRPDGSYIVLYVDTKGSYNSVHRYKDCTSCHGAQPHEVNTPLTKLSLSEKCGTCHEYEYRQHKKSVHGVPLQQGNTDPATCTDCHSATSDPHNVVRVLDPASSTYPKNVADTCAKCHNNPELMDKYGIVEKVYASYMRSFHGKAIKLAPKNSAIQQLDTATCVNCHGAHNITAVNDPKAPVAGKDNLLNTCRSCHRDAGPEFVKGFVGHKAVNSDFLPQVYWGGKSFRLFSQIMLGGGLLIVASSISLRAAPWITRKLRHRRRKEG